MPELSWLWSGFALFHAPRMQSCVRKNIGGQEPLGSVSSTIIGLTILPPHGPTKPPATLSDWPMQGRVMGRTLVRPILAFQRLSQGAKGLASTGYRIASLCLMNRRERIH